ncbi:MAG: FeoB-associated Cys-rich membrane protein [Lachnospiraceae bacterium]|nr:FeoB-associated Cys-rich membrane protein [Lachnospiraceae bacterium]
MVDVAIILIVILIVGAISLYLYKAKKRGETCIGCPYAKQCSSKGKCDSRVP